eukprot:10112_1
METRLINVENDIVEVSLKEQKQIEVNEKLKKQLEDVLQDKKDLSMEYVALRQNFNDRKKDLQYQKSKNEEIGVELLNLVNAKQALEETKSQLSEESEILKQKNEMLGEDNRVLKGSNRDNEAQLHSFDQETQELKLQLMKKESEAVLMNARLENAEANFGKKVLEIQKQSEKEVSDSQHQRLQEQTRLNKELNTLKQSLDVESG